MSAPHRVVTLAGSAGALPIMYAVASRARATGGASLFFIYHRGGAPAFEWGTRVSQAGFRAEVARAGEAILSNVLYHAHDAQAILVRDGRIVLVSDEARPHSNIDLHLKSIALEFGDRAVAFLLSGMGSDGVDGLRAIREAGGTIVVQHPRSAQFPHLPLQAIEQGLAHHVEEDEMIIELASRALAGEPLVRARVADTA